MTPPCPLDADAAATKRAGAGTTSTSDSEISLAPEILDSEDKLEEDEVEDTLEEDEWPIAALSDEEALDETFRLLAALLPLAWRVVFLVYRRVTA